MAGPGVSARGWPFDMHRFPGPGGLLSGGWPGFEMRELEVGARAAYAWEGDPGEWLTCLLYDADVAGVTPERLLTRAGQAALHARQS